MAQEWGWDARLDHTGRFITADLPYWIEGKKYNRTNTLDLDVCLQIDNGRLAWNWPGVVGFHSGVELLE